MNSRNTSYPLRLFEEFKASFLKDLRSYFRYPAWIIGEFVSTPLWFFFFALGVTLFAPVASTSNVPGFGSGMASFFFGFVFIILFSTSVWGVGQSVRNEQTSGTLEQFFLAPANRATLILGRWARIFLTDSIIIGYTTLLLYLFGGTAVSVLNPPLFLVSLALYEVSLIGFGLFMAGLTMRIKAFNSMGNVIFFGYMILTGALFPITVLPTPVRYFSMVIPFTYLNDVMRHAALGTPTILPLTLEYAAAVVSSLFMMAFGFISFNRIEQDARVKGSIASS
ncbi:MAG: ABC transporter permease [Candidatus Bathyarchaeia archaeon]